MFLFSVGNGTRREKKIGGICALLGRSVKRSFAKRERHKKGFTTNTACPLYLPTYLLCLHDNRCIFRYGCAGKARPYRTPHYYPPGFARCVCVAVSCCLKHKCSLVIFVLPAYTVVLLERVEVRAGGGGFVR